MCGIFATTRPDLWRHQAPDVLSLLRHRGPDDSGSLESNGAMLAHTRLSIIGLGDSGAQPASLPTGEMITFNGEIYNYRELAVGMDGRAAVSDTQVLLHGLSTRGLAFLDEVRGMYAFARWDPANHSLLAARDPWGIKPLYLLDHPSGGVTLCSEIGPLQLHEDGRTLDPIGIAQYVAFGHTLHQFTCHLRIRKLAPGVAYIWSAGSGHAVDLQTRRICQSAPSQPSVADALADSVRAHMVADVEVGVFLSSGLDSTLITALAAKDCKRLRTFTISFPEAPDIDESRAAALNARRLGVEHAVIAVTADDMLASLDRFSRTAGEPFGDAAALPLTALSEQVAREVKVVLTGEGADELLGGYGRYRISNWYPTNGIPGLIRPGRLLGDLVAAHRSDRPASRALEAILRTGGPESHGALLGSELPSLRGSPALADAVLALSRTDWRGITAGRRRREAARQFDLVRWLPNTYLEKTDRATMSHGLEARTPFLDPVVAEAVRGNAGFGKSVVAGQLHRIAPTLEFPDRKKGLAVPIRRLLAAGLQRDLDVALDQSDGIVQKIFGSETRARLEARTRLSDTAAYRLAMLGRWDTGRRG